MDALPTEIQEMLDLFVKDRGAAALDRLLLEAMTACACPGKMRGDPLCPCAMRHLNESDKAYIRLLEAEAGEVVMRRIMDGAEADREAAHAAKIKALLTNPKRLPG